LFFNGIRQFTLGLHSRVANPVWVDPANHDFHLQATSPAIDLGVSVGYSQDFDGALVPQDGNADGVSVPDVGSYEFHH
jgi:hypothetical protein